MEDWICASKEVANRELKRLTKKKDAEFSKLDQYYDGGDEYYLDNVEVIE